MNVVTVLQAYYSDFTLKDLSGKTDLGTTFLGRNTYSTFLTLAPSPVMSADACEIDVVLDVSVFMLWSSL